MRKREGGREGERGRERGREKEKERWLIYNQIFSFLPFEMYFFSFPF